MSLCDLTDKTVLITGASSGIGQAVAKVLDLQGARCILSGRSLDKLKMVSQELTGEHVIEPYDLSLTDEIPDWVEHLADKYGKLDGLVHSAGIHYPKPLQLLKKQDLDVVMTTNLYAAIFLSKGFRLKKVHSESASIVFISSVLGSVGQAGVLPYACSKGAIVSLTKSLAVELLRDQIRVNAVSPGVVNTEMTESFLSKMGKAQTELFRSQHPLGFGQPNDVAAMVAFLLSSDSRWITGSNIAVDGGHTAV